MGGDHGCEVAVAGADHVHNVPLEPFGGVDGAEDHVVVVELGRADGRPPRTAALTIRYAAVAVMPPRDRPEASRLPDVPLSFIAAYRAPEGAAGAGFDNALARDFARCEALMRVS